MTDQTLLGDFCSICNTNRSKYRCPGCSARTCSLPCYKRHQRWAQCSGQRDPTKFVKKSQLVTPAGIDHDFNFLTGIERDIEKAEKGLRKDGDGVAALPRSWSQQSQKGQTNYQQLEAAGVNVIRAPKGLSRQKENKSHRSSTKKLKGGKNIMWTVEWLDDQKRRLLTETSSTCQIAEAQPFAPQEQHKARKRKRNADAPLATNSSTLHHAVTSENQDKLVQLDVDHDVDPQVVSQERERSPSGGRASHPNEKKNQEVKTKLAKADPPDHRDDRPSTEPMGDGQRQFFLVKPRTISSRHVLIPLTSTATLGECLNGRTVLEFPTIYVFPGSVQRLPEEFMLEEEHLKQEGEEQKEFDELINELDPEILRRLGEDGRQSGNRTLREEEVDSSQILDVLKDFGAAL